SELTAQQERNEAKPWMLSDAPASYIDVMLRGIVGFRFAITRLEGKWKMSQNRDAKDRDGVAKGLGQRGDGDDLGLARIGWRHTKAGRWPPERANRWPEETARALDALAVGNRLTATSGCCLKNQDDALATPMPGISLHSSTNSKCRNRT